MMTDGTCIVNGSKYKCYECLIWRPGMKQLMEDRKLIKDNKKVIINDVVCTVTEAGLVTR
jgi:hypothetical protein